MKSTKLFLAVTIVMIGSSCATAQTSLNVVRTTTPPDLDGKVDDAVVSEIWGEGESFPRMRQTTDGLMFCGDGTGEPGGSCSPSPFCSADFNMDGIVNGLDFGTFAGQFGGTYPMCAP